MIYWEAIWQRASRNHARKHARKCAHTRGPHSTVYSIRRLRRPLRKLPQNSPKLLIPHVPPVVAKGVFVKIGLQVFRADAVVHAADPALHKTPESLNRLGVNVARDVDSRAMIDAPMGVTRRFQSVVGNKLIGVNSARRKDVFLRQPVQSSFLCVRRYARHDAANMPVLAALHHSHDRNLVAPVGWASTLADSLSLSAVVHLIHLHRRTLQLHPLFGEQRANLAEHAPRSFVGDACLPLNLLCGDAAASGTHEVHCIKPELERSGGLLEHSSGQWVDMIPAHLAGIGSAASHAVMLPLDAALLAFGDSIRPAFFLDIFEACIIVRKFAVEVCDRIAEFFGYALFGLHGRYRLPETLTCCQGIIAFCKCRI